MKRITTGAWSHNPRIKFTAMAAIPIREKRHRSSSTESGETETTLSVQPTPVKTRKKKAKRGDNDFACPFCKHDGQRWGTIDECGGWHSHNLGTLFRHHLFQKHKDANDSFALDDPRRIDPHRFVRLERWRKSLRLEKKRGVELWTTAYMILFGIDEADKDRVPSPYYTKTFVNQAVDEISAHIWDRAIHDPNFVRLDTLRMLAQTDELKIQRDLEKAYITEYFGTEIQGLKVMRDVELRRADEKYAKQLEQVHGPYKAQLRASHAAVSEGDLTYLGSAPQQSMSTDANTFSSAHLDRDAQDTLSPQVPQMATAPQNQVSSGWLNWSSYSNLRGRRQAYHHQQELSSASRLASELLLDYDPGLVVGTDYDDANQLGSFDVLMRDE